MSMVEINGVPIDCIVSFSQETAIEHDYVVQTLDRKKHAKWGGKRESLSLSIAPKSATDNDKIWEELTKASDYVTLKYPNTSHSTATRQFIIHSVQRPLLRKTNNVYRYGTISIEYEER